MSDPYGRLNPFNFDNPPDLVSFTVTPAIAEMGATITSAVLRWSFNRDLDSLTVNGVSTYSNQQATTVAGPFTTDQTWTILGSVQGRQTTGKAALSFQNKAYWGTGTTAPTNSAGILALPNSSFVTTKTKTSLGYACYDGKFPIYCVPSRIGVPTKIKVSALVPYTRAEYKFVDFSDFTASSVAFTNPSGFTETYTVLILNSLPAREGFSVQWA